MTENLQTDPSLTLGDTQARLEMLRTAMAEVIPMFDLNDAEAEQAAMAYVDRRVAELSPTSDKTTVGLDKGGTRAFISPDVDMVASELMSRPYHMDDPSAYAAAFRSIRQAHRAAPEDQPAERRYMNAVLDGATMGQAIYFGSYIGGPDARFEATADYVDSDLPEVGSIADIGAGAVCQERAAVAHNTLWVFGVASAYRTGTLATKNEDGTFDKEYHAFLTVSGTTGIERIFDPTNPIFIRNEDGKIDQAAPALYKLDLNEQGEQHGVQREFTVINGEPQQTDATEVIYTVNPL